MPADVVNAYEVTKGLFWCLPANVPFVFELDVQFKHSGSELNCPPAPSAPAVGASQHPAAGQEGSNVISHPGLKRKMQTIMQEMLSADDGV